MAKSKKEEGAEQVTVGGKKLEIVKHVESHIEVKIIFKDNEHTVSGDVANVLISKGVAKLVK